MSKGSRPVGQVEPYFQAWQQLSYCSFCWTVHGNALKAKARKKNPVNKMNWTESWQAPGRHKRVCFFFSSQSTSAEAIRCAQRHQVVSDGKDARPTGPDAFEPWPSQTNGSLQTQRRISQNPGDKLGECITNVLFILKKKKTALKKESQICKLFFQPCFLALLSLPSCLILINNRRESGKTS